MKGSYVEIKVDEGQRSFWDPTNRIVTLGKDYSPFEAAHELAHVRLEHDMSGAPLVDVVHERDAWKEALSRMNPEEVKVRVVSTSMNTYVRNVGILYGRDSRHYQLAVRMKDEVVELAKKIKGGKLNE